MYEDFWLVGTIPDSGNAHRWGRLCVCVCVCVDYTYGFIYVYMRIHTYMGEHTHVTILTVSYIWYMCACIYMWLYSRFHTYDTCERVRVWLYLRHTYDACVRVCVCDYTHGFICMIHVCVCVCVCVCVTILTGSYIWYMCVCVCVWLYSRVLLTPPQYTYSCTCAYTHT